MNFIFFIVAKKVSMEVAEAAKRSAFLIIYSLFFIFFSCRIALGEGGNTSADNQIHVDLENATPVTLWATMYYIPEMRAIDQGVPLRNMRDQVIGPGLRPKDWCLAAIEGSVRVADKVYNYSGVRDPRQAECSHKPSERVRWKATRHPNGTGSRNNPLVPFRTLACDLGTVANSKPWLNGGYARFGQKVYIPDAQGTQLPDGTSHDGIFSCGDVGGLIVGNHIDVFIGPVRGGLAEARRINPFSFIGSSASATFSAYVLP